MIQFGSPRMTLVTHLADRGEALERDQVDALLRKVEKAETAAEYARIVDAYLREIQEPATV
jgi:hypothetical protein